VVITWRAENEVKSAEAIAKGINWNAGVITAKLRLGAYFAVDRRYQDSEHEYLQAADLCADTKCGTEALIYDHLFPLYAVFVKDIGRAEKVADSVIALGNKTETEEPLETRIKQYADILREAGHSAQADALEQRISNLPNAHNQ
jgi:hypothetical protein